MRKLLLLIILILFIGCKTIKIETIPYEYVGVYNNWRENNVVPIEIRLFPDQTCLIEKQIFDFSGSYKNTYFAGKGRWTKNKNVIKIIIPIHIPETVKSNWLFNRKECKNNGLYKIFYFNIINSDTLILIENDIENILTRRNIIVNDSVDYFIL